MIVVIGTPAWRAADPPGPAGRACAIALAAVAGGARVELVGRTGDDAAGDALLLALAAAGVGHVAVLRDPARPTPIEAPGVLGDEEAFPPVATTVEDPPPHAAASGPRLEPADVSLGLAYLTAFDVLVAPDDVPAAVLPVAVDAAAFAGAALVVLVAPGEDVPDGLPASATVIAAPTDADGAFAAVVAAYASALDRGLAPADAFALSLGAGGAAPVT